MFIYLITDIFVAKKSPMETIKKKILIVEDHFIEAYD